VFKQTAFFSGTIKLNNYHLQNLVSGQIAAVKIWCHAKFGVRPNCHQPTEAEKSSPGYIQKIKIILDEGLSLGNPSKQRYDLLA
jgi:hypothetical protein